MAQLGVLKKRGAKVLIKYREPTGKVRPLWVSLDARQRLVNESKEFLEKNKDAIEKRGLWVEAKSVRDVLEGFASPESYTLEKTGEVIFSKRYELLASYIRLLKEAVDAKDRQRFLGAKRGLDILALRLNAYQGEIERMSGELGKTKAELEEFKKAAEEKQKRIEEEKRQQHEADLWKIEIGKQVDRKAKAKAKLIEDLKEAARRGTRLREIERERTEELEKKKKTEEPPKKEVERVEAAKKEEKKEEEKKVKRALSAGGGGGGGMPEPGEGAEAIMAILVILIILVVILAVFSIFR